jgi:hypothetical protein
MADEYEKTMEALKEEHKEMLEKDESFLARAKSAVETVAHRAGETIDTAKSKYNRFQTEQKEKKKAHLNERISTLEEERGMKLTEAKVRTLENQNRKLDEQGREHRMARFNRVFGGAKIGQSTGFSPSLGGGKGMMPSLGGKGAFTPSMGGGRAMPSLGKGSMPSLGDKKTKSRGGTRNIVIKIPRMK